MSLNLVLSCPLLQLVLVVNIWLSGSSLATLVNWSAVQSSKRLVVLKHRRLKADFSKPVKEPRQRCKCWSHTRYLCGVPDHRMSCVRAHHYPVKVIRTDQHRLPFALMISPLERVVRSDGTRILVSEKVGTKQEFKLIKKTMTSSLIVLSAFWAMWSFFYRSDP